MPRDSKTLGAYFTPEAVAPALVRWAVRDRSCVCGYLFVMRANRAEEVGRDLGVDEEGSFGDRSARKLTENDVALDARGRPVESIRRFHAALRELADRRGI